VIIDYFLFAVNFHGNIISIYTCLPARTHPVEKHRTLPQADDAMPCKTTPCR